MTQRRTAPRSRSSAGWRSTRPRESVPGAPRSQVPVSAIEAVTVRHHTSRAGDPHRHLHLQINARVLAEGVWRGLHTVGVRDSIEAINGIGHAAVMTDPRFRAALAGHGYTLDPDTGEIVQLAKFVGPFSARAAQIGRNIDRYEADWRAANPGREPGPALRRAWDARAWADARPDKVVPSDGAELTRRWVAELRELGYRDPTAPVPVGRGERRQCRSGAGGRRGADAARGAPLGLERGRHPRSGRAAAGPPRHRHRAPRCVPNLPRTSPRVRWPSASRCCTAPACPNTSAR